MNTTGRCSAYISLPRNDVRQIHCTFSTTVQTIVKNVLGQISLSDYAKLFELEAHSLITGLTVTLYVELSIREIVSKLGQEWLTNYRLFLKVKHLNTELYDNFKSRNGQMLEILYFQCLEEVIKDSPGCDHEQFLRFLTLELKRRFLEQNVSAKPKNSWISKQLHSLACATKIPVKSFKSEFSRLKSQTSAKLCMIELLNLHRCTIGLVYKKFSCFLNISDDLMVVEIIMRSLDGISYRIPDQSWRMLCSFISVNDGIKNVEMKKFDEGKGQVTLTMASSSTEFYGAISVMEEIAYYVRRLCAVNGVNLSPLSVSPVSDPIPPTLPPIIVSLPDVMIAKGRVDIGEAIGKGQFGSVYRALLRTSNGSSRHVALKVHRGNESVALKGFYEEADFMRRLEHPNVIAFFGLMEGTPAILMELARFGELRVYLQTHESIQLITLMLFSLQISRAVEYLHSLDAIHCDLASRNVLVFSHDCVKLSDFGLCCFLPPSKVHHLVSDRKMPIKWMSPESLRQHIFTKATDVWMLGVCLWEVWVRGGKKPFEGVDNCDVLIHIEAGNSLPQPEECPDYFFEMLENCWNHNHQSRPTATELVVSIESLYSEFSVASGSLPLVTSSHTLAPNEAEKISQTSYSSFFLTPEKFRNLADSKPSINGDMMMDSALSNLYNSIINLTEDASQLRDSMSQVESSLNVFLDMTDKINLSISNDLANKEIYMEKCSLRFISSRLAVIGRSNHFDDSVTDRVACLVAQVGTSAGLLYRKIYECSLIEMSSDV